MKLLKTIGILLLIVLIAGLCLNAVGVINAENWYNDTIKKDTEDDKVVGTTDNDEVIEEGKTYALASSMLYTQSNKTLANNMSATTQSTAVNLVATVLPSDATNKYVDWDVEWVDEDSTWATGKDVEDYVTATPTEDGSTTASVECLEAFGEQIQIIVTSRDNSSARATCVVDYEKFITDYTVNIAADGGPVPTISGNTITAAYNPVRLHFSATNIQYTTGTVYHGSTVVTTKVKLGPEVGAPMGGPYGSAADRTRIWTLVDNSFHFGFNAMSDLDIVIESSRESTYKYYLTKSNVDFIFTFEIEDITKTYNVNIDDSSFKVDVTGVTLSKGTLEF